MTICKNCQSAFEITSEDLAFYDKISPIFGGKKVSVPKPKLCPDCRDQRRRSFRNDRFYYHGACELCKKKIISVYDPERIGPVYCNQCWWGERWDPMDYARNYDFSRPFFEQFKELWDSIPKIAMMNDNNVQSENCEYTTDLALSKNAYMVTNSWYVENSMFGVQTNYVKNCIDNLYLYRCELMYECIVCQNSYNCQNCHQVTNSNDCILGYDLVGCNNCILSAGLRNKKYYIWNKPYNPEEFAKEKAKLRLDSWSARENLKKQFAEFLRIIPHKYANLVNCENCTGDNLFQSKNSQNCYHFPNLFHCKFLSEGDIGRYCYDCNSTGNPELCYECLTPDNGYMNCFTINCWNSQYLLYSENCHNASQYLFGCTGLKKKKYCILNKQYSKEKYEALMPKIIEHMKSTKEWGEFFSTFVSPFYYNETTAHEFFPLTEDQAQKMGYHWSLKPHGSFGKETISWPEIPNSIDEVKSDGLLASGKNILVEILACQKCAKNYKIAQQEFDFYKKHSIPPPKLCPNCRYKGRRARLNPKKLWKRTCMCKQSAHDHQGDCNNKFETPFNPDRLEKIYCEQCYLKEVY